MTVTVTVKAKDLARRIKSDLKKKQKLIDRAVQRSAKKGAAQAKENAPEAYAELKDGISWEPTSAGAKVTSDAPHSAPVETGTRPHTPPFEAILRWVILRTSQGLTGSGRISKKAPAVARTIAGMVRAAGGKDDAEAAVTAVAWAIVNKIKREGTKPTWFMKNAVPVVEEELDWQIKQALADRTP